MALFNAFFPFMQQNRQFYLLQIYNLKFFFNTLYILSSIMFL